MTKKILVTGASGFIAAHTIIELLNHGYEVRGTIRDLKKADKVRAILAKHHAKGGEIELVAATLTEVDGWAEAVAGCDGILHLASPVAMNQPKDANELIVPAKQGVLHVLQAAVDANINRVVMTSSVAAVAGNEDAGKKALTDKHWSKLDHPGLNAYAQSKTIAEQTAWEFQKQHPQLQLTTVNPALVFGPALEADYGSSLEALMLLLKGKYPMLPKLTFGIVDVRDVASLHRLAFEQEDAIGQRLLCSHESRSFLAISQQLRNDFPAYKNKLTTRTMPNWLVHCLAIFDPTIASIRRDIGLAIEYDCRPAHQLGWRPRTPEEAIKAGAESLISLGLV